MYWRVTLESIWKQSECEFLTHSSLAQLCNAKTETTDGVTLSPMASKSRCYRKSCAPPSVSFANAEPNHFVKLVLPSIIHQKQLVICFSFEKKLNFLFGYWESLGIKMFFVLVLLEFFIFIIITFLSLLFSLNEQMHLTS